MIAHARAGEGPRAFGAQRESCRACAISRLLRGLEKLDWIPVGIFYLDLSAAGTSLDLVSKSHSCVLQRVDLRRQIRDAQDDSIPATRLLGLAAGHRTRSRCSWPAEQEHEVPERHTGKRGKVLNAQPEAEMVRIEGDRPRDIRHLIAHAVHARDASRLFVHHTLLRLSRR